MRCFYCQEITEIGSCVTLSSQDERHLFRINRASIDDEVELVDGLGVIAIAEVIPGKQLKIKSYKKIISPSKKVNLFLAPPKKQKMEQLLRQVTELGVWSVTPILTKHSVYMPEKVSIMDRWKTIMIEACKQAKNPFIPEITLPITFEEGIQKAVENKMESFFGSVRDVESTAVNLDFNSSAWFVGPEGGFTLSEEEQMLKSKFTPLKIGNWVLRVETAAVAGLAYLLK